MAHYQAGRCKEALVAFEEVVKARPAPGVLRKVAECRTKLAQWKEAQQAWRAYLALDSIADRSEASGELVKVEAAQAQAQARKAPPPAELPASLDHTPLMSIRAGNAPVLMARVAQGKAVPRLRARLAGLQGFASFQFEPAKGSSDLFAAQLPAVSEPFDYFVELVDESGRAAAFAGSATQPFHVSLKDSPTEVAASSSTQPKSGVARTLGVALGVLGGAAASIGVLLTVSSQDKLGQYRAADQKDVYQEVRFDEAKSAVTESQVGLALLGAGLLCAGIGFTVAF